MERCDLIRNVESWTRIDKWEIAIGYDSGRIEIRDLKQPEAPVVAVGFVVGIPNSMAVSESSLGRFLVVSAGDLVWLDLSPLAPHP